jgi:hypothetical protein
MLDNQKFKRAIPLFLADDALYFRFLPNLSGLSYNIVNNYVVNEFLTSPYLVRDRELLAKNEIWNTHKQLFMDKSFLVSIDEALFFCPAKVWSPSVDAIFLYETLCKESIVNNASSFFDIGCGTGAISIALATKFNNINYIIAEDVDPLALSAFAINFYINDLVASYLLTTCYSSQIIRNDLVDIAITTPYYFPVAKHSSLSPDDEIYQAIEQTVLMIKKCISLSTKASYFIYSSTTELEVKQLVNEDWEVINSLSVPFTIGDNVGNSEVVQRAIKDGRLKMLNKNNFLYSHTIYIGRKLK